ncbi:hypothetical protein J2129_001866 [Methanofollis sp. W23]|uniref:hypothetical protein n=1 Tax=Methanofollis sp. W23 TaxID=2817849 RepID=UPI001AEB9971|nr:hypothetical protein [Methanofollis sp. W23]MBP2146412.1 hypothetical protein [Methanofollis sp. W23]
MDFEIQKPDGTREYVTMMSYGSFGDISRVGKIAGLDLDEYDRITEYSGLEEEWVIQLEDVRKILLFYREMLNLVEELDRKGISLLTETEEQRRKRELARMRTTPRDRWNGVISSLHQLIDLCEKAIKSGGSIVMII